MLAHGFGCDQNMWRFTLPEFEKNFRVVLFDYVGCGKSDLSAFSKDRYKSLEGYASDIEDILTALDLQDVSIVGHSVSSIIAGLALKKCPDRISDIAMISPSPSFINSPPDYFGGFEREDLQELINLMDKNYIRWANYLAPLVMGAGHSSELIEELSDSFCSTDPIMTKTFAIATFFSDYRAMLNEIDVPVLVLQSAVDSLAPIEVGEYTATQIKKSQYKLVKAVGHCLHMTDPDKVAPLIIDFIQNCYS